ncbi:MAG: hypothetical protein QM757_30840 [Paludibaculum sp.]
MNPNQFARAERLENAGQAAAGSVFEEGEEADRGLCQDLAEQDGAGKDCLHLFRGGGAKRAVRLIHH